jgi:cell division protein FtsL
MRPHARGPSPSLPLRQLIVVVLAVALGMVAVSFARVLVVEYQLGLEKQALEADILRLSQENEQLRQQIGYLQTDAAIEKLAREELGWTKPGETAVIVLKDTSTPVPTNQPVTEPRALPDGERQHWWEQILRALGLG